MGLNYGTMVIMVLKGLVGTPFESLESVPVKLLTLKMIFLMAISSLENLQVLSILPSSLDFSPGPVKAILHPHPDYLPKVTFSEQVRLHLLCPVRVL